MEHLEYEFEGGGDAGFRKRFSIVGVVSSGNLEVMAEAVDLGGRCRFSIDTAAEGFAAAWEAVLRDFMERHRPANLRVSINDGAASPSVVGLRLDQAMESLKGE